MKFGIAYICELVASKKNNPTRKIKTKIQDKMDKANFTFQKPKNAFLASIVDDYFYIDTLVSELNPEPEFIIPYPRITFGYFFNHPFTATNQTLNESAIVNISISKISTQKIIVQPNSDRIKICGAHINPFALAYLTKTPIHSFPWLINTEDLFGDITRKFIKRLDKATDTETMFAEVEKVFLDNLLVRDLSLITEAVNIIENSEENIEISKLAKELGVTDRTLRNHFYDYVGCSPKEYIKIVKLKKVAYQLAQQKDSLTEIAYDNQYFDQAHFIKELKEVTGFTPGELRKEIANFRFLQF